MASRPLAFQWAAYATFNQHTAHSPTRNGITVLPLLILMKTGSLALRTLESLIEKYDESQNPSPRQQLPRHRARNNLWGQGKRYRVLHQPRHHPFTAMAKGMGEACP